MAHRTPTTPDRDRYRFERERFAQGDFSDDDNTDDLYPPPRRGPGPARDRLERDRSRPGNDPDDLYPPPRRGPPVRDRERDRSRPGSRERRSSVFVDEEEDEVLVRERMMMRRGGGFEREREQEGRMEVRRRAGSPPPHAAAAEVERERVVIERERYRSPSPARPPPPPRLVRRQSSLDTFDRKPAARRYWEREREEPPRRDEGRVPPYVDIPLPRARALPPPRVYAERDEVRVASSHVQRYEDEGFPPYPERVREREVVTTRRRSRSRSRARGRSRSSSESSASSAGGTVLMPRDEYPKKGKTRIPARLVSKRALIELSYPYVEEVRAHPVKLGEETLTVS